VGVGAGVVSGISLVLDVAPCRLGHPLSWLLGAGVCVGLLLWLFPRVACGLPVHLPRPVIVSPLCILPAVVQRLVVELLLKCSGLWSGCVSCCWDRIGSSSSHVVGSSMAGKYLYLSAGLRDLSFSHSLRKTGQLRSLAVWPSAWQFKQYL